VYRLGIGRLERADVDTVGECRLRLVACERPPHAEDVTLELEPIRERAGRVVGACRAYVDRV
jgi:hypothetical protein